MVKMTLDYAPRTFAPYVATTVHLFNNDYCF